VVGATVEVLGAVVVGASVVGATVVAAADVVVSAESSSPHEARATRVNNTTTAEAR
jgi:hypothetical protein